MPRVYIHFETTDAPWGGGNNFLRALRTAIPQCGGRVASHINDEYEVFLFNNGYEAPGRYLSFTKLQSMRRFGRTRFLDRLVPFFWQVKPRKPKARSRESRKIMVHRLDGIARLYGRTSSLMDEIQLAANRFADFTIFQSRFCLESFRTVGYREDTFAIIGNGADPEIFFPPEREVPISSGSLRLAAAAWSGNPMKGHVTLAALSELPDVSITFVGRWPESIDPGNVKRAGALSQPELAQVLRASHGFVHAAQNDPCPNVVYEALCCGLPVLYLDSGGTPEIASGHGLPLEEPFGNCLSRFHEMIPGFRNRVLADREQFTINSACREYIALFSRLCGR